MTRYAIGLGSNLGDRLGYLRAGVVGIGELGTVVAVSGLYETAPVGGPEQGPYLNAVALIETDVTATTLLSELQRFEQEQHRVRKERWGARTLDLDILASDGAEVDTDHLQIPHPSAPNREFVLRPLTDIWPEALVADGLPAKSALESVGDQDVDLLARQWVEDDRGSTGRFYVAMQVVWFVAIAVALALDGTLPEGSDGGIRIVGGIVAIVGAALAFVSSRRLGSALSALPEPLTAADAELVQTGPYGLARHPMYGGVTLFILGTSLILDSITGALLSLGLFPFFYLKSTYEERRLRMQYAGYRAYRQVVTRRFIPFVF